MTQDVIKSHSFFSQLRHVNRNEYESINVVILSSEGEMWLGTRGHNVWISVSLKKEMNSIMILQGWKSLIVPIYRVRKL